MSDSDYNIDFSPTDMIVGLSSIYVLFNYSVFLAWAATLSAPIAGYMQIIVYLMIVVGAIEVIALIVVGVVLAIGLLLLIVKGVLKLL